MNKFKVGDRVKVRAWWLNDLGSNDKGIIKKCHNNDFYTVKLDKNNKYYTIGDHSLALISDISSISKEQQKENLELWDLIAG